MPVARNHSRRTFLQNLAAAGAATVVHGSVGVHSSVSEAVGADSPSERPVFATIGLRNQGWQISKWALEVADIAAFVDVDSKVTGATVDKLMQREGVKKPDTYNDYRKVLDRDDIDAVMIATPDHWHTKMAVEAMYAGKDVYCEKPLTLTIDEGKLIEKVVKETGRVFQVGTMQRSAKLFLQAVAMVRDGRIGKLQRVRCNINGLKASPKIPIAPIPDTLDWDQWLGPAPKVDYRALPKMREGYGGGVPLFSNCHYSFRNWHAYAGGKLTDWGAHHVDIATWAIGADPVGTMEITPVSFKMACEHVDGYPVVDDQYNAAIQFELKVHIPHQDGPDHDVEMTISHEGGNGIMFEGTAGRFFVNRGKIVGKPVEDLEQNPLPDGAIEAVYGGPVIGHVENFVDCMKTRNQPISDVFSHNRMLETCHLSNIAMRLDRSIQWDPIKRTIIDDEQANSFLSREYRKGFEIDS